MYHQILLNLIIAVAWTFLYGTWSNVQFVVGYLIGLIILWGLRRWNSSFYMVKVWKVLKLLLIFNKELFISSYDVIRHVLRPQMTMRPGIIKLDTQLRTDWEITLLSCLICLTPGTLTLDVSMDNHTLYIHAMDIQDAEELSKHLKDTFEKAIMEVTRT
ncbi:Na+/H+ antiporter subunit E [Paenibacillus sanguinis]|uniref:Na+/H+ antiporter subunit E n=1 Tax=Paenibacillus sanguinis TaxID=225906 RepID=UPI000376EC0B|nr:Na+/H+ antiporter subunit E [Paenibacillus sanguinis]